MQSSVKIPKGKQILFVLCNPFYKTVKDIVNKYSQKQEEKDIVNQEEVLVRSIYRDFVDEDIFNDFDLLFEDDFFIISTIQKTKEGDVEGFHSAVKQILDFLSNDAKKQKIKQICAKYKKESKSEWIFRQAIVKIDKYVPSLTQ